MYSYRYASISQLYPNSVNIEHQNTFSTIMKSWKRLYRYLPLDQNPLSEVEERKNEQKPLERPARALRPCIFSKINLLVLVLALSNFGLLSLLLCENKATQSPPGYSMFSIKAAAGVHD